MALRTPHTGADAYPAPVDVHIGADWESATAHADRVSRHGHQVLITHHGHLMWVAAHRVRRLDRAAGGIGSELRSARVEPV